MACPRCGSNDLWEDNFWSGCNKCSWMESCENNIKIVPQQRYSYTPKKRNDDD